MGKNSDAHMLWAYWRARLAGDDPKPASRDQWRALCDRFPPDKAKRIARMR